MQNKWQRRKILIWGKTRPEISMSYREIVCTGGVFADTKRLVRLYPIPLRYLDDEKIFRKYQWIEADVTKSSSDARPESYKIRPDTIQILDRIPSKNGNWDLRAEWVMNEGNIFRSVEALQKQQAIDHTSLGLVRPLEVTDVYCRKNPQPEIDNYWERYKKVINQLELPLDPETQREIKPLRPPEYRFKVKFRCDDPECSITHDFSVLDWELDALFARLRREGLSNQVAAGGVVESLATICNADNDLHFYLGNISNHPHIFTIVGLWRPKKKALGESKQLTLL